MSWPQQAFRGRRYGDADAEESLEGPTSTLNGAAMLLLRPVNDPCTVSSRFLYGLLRLTTRFSYGSIRFLRETVYGTSRVLPDFFTAFRGLSTT